MDLLKKSFTIIICFLSFNVLSNAVNLRDPSIGYIYPAGAQKGTTCKVLVGGQRLRMIKDVVISGQGVHAHVVKYIKPITNLDKEQRWLLLKSMFDVFEQRVKDSGIAQADIDKILTNLKKHGIWSQLHKKVDLKGVTLSDHPLLMNLKDKTIRELLNIQDVFFFPRRKLQKNRQLDESLLIEVVVDSDATLGDRLMSLKTSKGFLTSPMVFQIGKLNEVSELEPNNLEAYPVPNSMKLLKTVLQKDPLQVPIVINGQVMPGDVDRFKLHFKKGQKLIISADARRLHAYLADAVPGWFQAVLALYDSSGHEVAYNDDHLFSPDPVLFYKVPEEGDYEIEIRDSIYRGRVDFVYRLSISSDPALLSEFEHGSTFGDIWSQREVLPVGMSISDVIPSDLKDIPCISEKEDNNSIKHAQRVDLPSMITGAISKPGDVDMFRINGEAGDKIVAEVYARRLGSPMNSVLRLIDNNGKVVAWNDDNIAKEKKFIHLECQGIITHHADSYLMAELPVAGTYYIQLADVENAGGKKYGYRLRISKPRPGFALRVTPSSLFSRPGDNIPMTVYAIRRDGFEGDIKIGLSHPYHGFMIAGGVIPADCNSIRMTIRAPVKAPDHPLKLNFVGSAHVGDSVITGSAMAAQVKMQAFLFQHIVPYSNDVVLNIQKQKWPVRKILRLDDGPVEVPVGGSVLVNIKYDNKKRLDKTTLTLDNPPEGLSIEGPIKIIPEGFAFTLKACKDSKVGFAGNIIIGVLAEGMTKVSAKSKKKPVKTKWQVCSLPAIPVNITK